MIGSRSAEKPERKAIRLQGYSYSRPGYYFITICCAGGSPHLGQDGIRSVAETCWLAIPEHFKNVGLDAYVLMPNHIHGIIVIRDDGGRVTPWRDPTFGPLQRNSLASIVNQFKGSVRRWCNKNGCSYFRWQSRFYDHVIRNERELVNVRKYIIENPLRWNLDAENPALRKSRTRIEIDEYYRNIFDPAGTENL